MEFWRRKNFNCKKSKASYSKAGNYTVNLTGANGYGTDSKSAQITVLEKPLPPLIRKIPFAYIPNYASNTVSVIDLNTNNITATVPVGNSPYGVAVSLDASKVYIANNNSSNVSVINTTTNSVTVSTAVGNGSSGVAIIPDGSKVYLTNFEDNTTSVIDTATNNITATVPVGSLPFAFGQFIG